MKAETTINPKWLSASIFNFSFLILHSPSGNPAAQTLQPSRQTLVASRKKTSVSRSVHEA
jgi:hypothetical protein